MSPFMQGLEITLISLFIKFATMGVFILIMVILQKIFPGKEETKGEETAVIDVQSSDGSDEGAVVAAIAAALEYTRAGGRGNLGQALSETRGGWWLARRQEARQGDVKVRR